MSSKKSGKKRTQGTTSSERPAKRKRIVSLAEYEAEEAKVAHVGEGAETAETPTVAPTAPRKRATGEPGGASRGPSGLDLAATVMKEAGRPMNAKEICEGVIAAGWKTNGKTPASTLYAAIITEIGKKGDQSRFRKVDRGRFELTE